MSDNVIVPSSETSDASQKVQTHVFKVAMSCGGCSGAVERALKAKGVEQYTTDLKTQKVTVTTVRPLAEVEEIIKKTGKACEYLESVDGPAASAAAPADAAEVNAAAAAAA
ncbi:Cytosolic copper metallochaperone [Coemansia erecta]|uniref:Cytosolic copper metallochaperone n=1 Tax=Coemansia erecta TaxID=147472 RepID=A0A9W7XYA3_9FUNG|nr:Cytosolic copper metallochaperone [Coemansia erecta]